MPRKKIEFTKEQITRITELLNNGASLDDVLTTINTEFEANFSRSSIHRCISSFSTPKTDNESCGDNKIELLREWKRKQAYTYGEITNSDIAKALNISDKTLNRWCKKYDIPQRCSSWERPDIVFDVKQCDCTSLKKSIADRVYDELLKIMPDGMRIERDTVVTIPPMTIRYEVNEGNKVFTKHADMKAVDMKVDFYFPDYNIAFYCSTIYGDLLKDDYNQNISMWHSYLYKHSEFQLLPFTPVDMSDITKYSLSAAAKCIMKDLKKTRKLS